MPSILRRSRASRRPRPAEPPQGYDGNYNGCWNIPMGRRPRPSGAPPAITNKVLSSSDQVVQTGNDVFILASAVAEGTDLVTSRGEARFLMAAGEEDEHTTGGIGNADSPPPIRTTADTPTRGGAASAIRVEKNQLATLDPLLHSGHWVPAEYQMNRPIPWTGCWTCCGDTSSYTTHCASFDARTTQRKADYTRHVSDRMGRARKEIAAVFREQWGEGKKREPAVEMRGDKMPTTVSTSDRYTMQDPPFFFENRLPPARPFLRKKWLDRQARRDGAAIMADTGSLLSAGEKSATSFLRNRLVVRRDHVRSVVKLALSEARVNAFVAINSLEGLLAVATEGPDFGSGKSERETNCEGFSVGAVKAGSTLSEARDIPCFVKAFNSRHNNKADPSLSTLEPNFSDSNPPIEFQDKATSSVRAARFELNQQSVSGACLCINLGALPAIIGCLNQHPGHPQIESLAIKLFQIFALDPTTSGAIRGNINVAVVCVARLCSPCFSGGVAKACFDIKGGSISTEQAVTLLNGSSNAHIIDGGETETDGQTAEVSGTENTDRSPTLAMVSMPENSQEATSKSKASGLHEQSVESVASVARVVATAGVAGQRRDRQYELSMVPNVSLVHSTGSTEASKPGTQVLPELRELGHQTTGTTIVPSPLNKMGNQDVSSAAATIMFVLSIVLQDSSGCQLLVLRKGGLAAVLNCLQGSSERGIASDDPRLTESCLRVLQQLTQDGEDQMRAVKRGGIKATLLAMDKFRSDDGVLTAAMGLLMPLCESGMGRRLTLKAGGVGVVFRAMQRLVGEAVVQVKGADMLQTLITEEPQARREFDGIKGGWQWLCQGTSGGNALVRFAPGNKQISGWTISQEEGIATSQALKAAERVASEWSAHNLARFMGRGRNKESSQHTWSTNEHYFRVVKEAGLLPHRWEGVEEWRQRTRRYEEDHDVRINHITRRRIARDKAAHHSSSTFISTTFGVPY